MNRNISGFTYQLKSFPPPKEALSSPWSTTFNNPYYYIHFHEVDGEKEIPGTTTVEVIKMLIDHLSFVNNIWKDGADHCEEVSNAIEYLDAAQKQIEKVVKDENPF